MTTKNPAPPATQPTKTRASPVPEPETAALRAVRNVRQLNEQIASIRSKAERAMTEKAPSPLPEVLPAGVTARNGRWVVGPGGAKLGGAYEVGSGSQFYWCDWADPRSHKAESGTRIEAEDIDWPSYYAALRTPPSPPSEGFDWKVGDRAWHTEAKQECVLVARNSAATSCGAWFADFGDKPGDRHVPVLAMFLRRLTPAASPSPQVDNAHIECPNCKTETFHLARQRCDRCGLTNHAIIARVTGKPKLTASGAAWAQPKEKFDVGEPPKVAKVGELVDPYKRHQEELYGKTGVRTERFREWYDWSSAQDAKHAAMKAQHLADFDRPIRTPANRRATERLAVEVKAALRTWGPADEGEP